MGYHYKYKEYVYRHMYPKKSSALFTYHRHPDGRGGFLDDGTCELCGTRGKTVLIENEKPRCCYKCYLKLRGSKTEPFGAIGLQNAKRIVRNADVLKQKKKAGLAIALGLLLLDDKE